MKMRRGFMAWRKYAAAAFAAAAITVTCAASAFAEGEAAAPAAGAVKIDSIVSELENVMPGEPRVINLEECIKMAIENNQELRMKQAILNSVDGDKMMDRSRFYSHVDFIADVSRNSGSLQKSYFPVYNPQPVSSLGTLDANSLSLSSKGSSSSGSLGGMDVSQISSLAASFGVSLDPALIQQYLGGLQRPAGVSANRTAAAPEDCTGNILQDLTNGCLSTEDLVTQLQQLSDTLNRVNEMFGTTPKKNTFDSQVGIRYSRRLLEWGKDSSSSVQIRANRRLAIYNYQQKLREVVSQTRATFFTILLKKQQIATREKLLAEYEEKLRQQQKRFEVAQDVPKIDVLTAELDVLNEKNRISVLKSDMLDKKNELLLLTNMPYDSNVEFAGDLQPLNTDLKEVVELTKKNSYQITYLQQEYKEDLREFDEKAWDYKPIISGKVGVEDNRTVAGLTLNNSNQTYGLDFGVAEYLNLPHSTSADNSNYSISAGVTWNLFDNTHRKGVSKKFLEKLNETKSDLDRQVELEELNARKAFNSLMEAKEKLELQAQIVENAKKRLEITRKLRESGRVTEYQLDSYRDTFFSQEDRYFTEQENLITAQENLRRVMGIFY